MVFVQTSYHFLRYQKDRNAYIPKERLLVLDSSVVSLTLLDIWPLRKRASKNQLSTDKSKVKGHLTHYTSDLKKFYIYLDPTGKYFFDNKFIDLLISNDEGLGEFLQDTRFIKQDMFIFTGVNPINVLMLNSEKLLKYSIMVGVNEDGTAKTCYKPHIFQMLLDSETVSAFDLFSFASRFACDCNDFVVDSFDISKLDKNQRVNYYNAFRAFTREALNILKPVKISVKLSFADFFRYVIMNNITMGSPDLEAREKGGDGWVVFFAMFTYFLLALQATILGTRWERIIT